MVWSNRNIIIVFRASVSGIGIIEESVLSKHCPIYLLASLACAILSVPIESDQCAL